ncbi:MAG: hypothetical protein ACRDTI_10510 [Mycobacterium sp.]
MTHEPITIELIEDMRKAADTIERAARALAGVAPRSHTLARWDVHNLRYFAGLFARELSKDLPAMLQSLDCDAARGGTVWRDSMPDHPWLYRHHQGAWWWKTPSARSWHPLVMHDAARLKLFLSGCGPYVAVGQSAGERP